MVEVPKKSMYDTGYFDEEESVREMSTRARRTRKGTSDPGKPLDRQTSRQSLDDLSRKGQSETLKRRGTNKKIDAEKAKSAAGRDTKEKKLSDSRRPAGGEEEEQDDSELESGCSPEAEEVDEKNVVFCMWGHENCKTRSHYRYNWQWDYVTKYAEQHNKHLVQGFVPKEPEQTVSVRKMALEAEKAQLAKEKEEKEKNEEDRKPGKEGIRTRMRMLQNKLTAGKASDTVKQHMFERDLELEMLRRKKNYQQLSYQTGERGTTLGSVQDEN